MAPVSSGALTNRSLLGTIMESTRKPLSLRLAFAALAAAVILGAMAMIPAVMTGGDATKVHAAVWPGGVMLVLRSPVAVPSSRSAYSFRSFRSA
jgi:hypothetical protein